MKIDYLIDDSYQLIIYTEEAQKVLWHIFGKMVPLDAHIKLTKEDMIAIHLVLSNKNNALCGIYGPCHIEEEPDNEYEWTDL